MNLKWIGKGLINFDNVLHITFGENSSGTDLKATFRFVDGSEHELGHDAARTLLKWIEKYTDSEVDPLGQYDGLTAMIEAFGPKPDEVEP